MSLDLAGDAERFGHFLVGFSVVGLMNRGLSCVLDRVMDFKNCGCGTLKDLALLKLLPALLEGFEVNKEWPRPFGARPSSPTCCEPSVSAGARVR